MRLSERDRQRFAHELQFIVKQMREHQSNVPSQTYFFSAAYGLANRLLNERWDTDLSLIHLVLQATFTAIQSRLQSLGSGTERAVMFPERFMEALIETTEKLEGAIREKRDSDIAPILARFSELCHTTSGNGYYLFLKGEIKI